LQHALDQAALHRIVVDNKDRHRSPGNKRKAAGVPFRGTLGERS
jgi:hypothetical protein